MSAMALREALERAGVEIPELPDKLFFTIREVSEICGVEPHVLRYWESEFRHHIRPVKKSGNRRFYRQRDIYAILQIKHLLHELKFTIKGAKRVLQSGEWLEIAERQDVRARLVRIRNELAAALQLLED